MTSNFYRGVSWTVRSWRTYGGVYLRKENAFIIKSPKRVIDNVPSPKDNTVLSHTHRIPVA